MIKSKKNKQLITANEKNNDKPYINHTITISQQLITILDILLINEPIYKNKKEYPN